MEKAVRAGCCDELPRAWSPPLPCGPRTLATYVSLCYLRQYRPPLPAQASTVDLDWVVASRADRPNSLILTAAKPGKTDLPVSL